MRYAYRLIPLEQGHFMVEFRDVPAALGYGESRNDAIYWAEDCLLCALGGYMLLDQPIPQPSPCKPGDHYVEVPPLAAIKLAIYEGLREQNMSKAQLAEAIGVDPKNVRRLLDLAHNSRLDQLQKALAILGLKLDVSVRKAA